MKNNVIHIKNKISEKRAQTLYSEFVFAWNNTSKEEKLKWSKETAKIFGKVTLRRLKGFTIAVGKLAGAIGLETFEFGKSIYKNEAKSYIIDRKTKAYKYVKDSGEKSKSIIKDTLTLLKTNPNEAGPALFLGIIGFFAGSGGFDANEGIPDLDIAVGGIGNHRSIFFHSIISAAVLETMVYSTILASKTIHKNLPENHDPFWDKASGYEKWTEAFLSGACIGIAYHLLIDGTIQGNKAYTDLPIKGLSMETHNAILVSNSMAEFIDAKKKLTDKEDK